MVFRNKTILTHESVPPSADYFTPCQVFRPIRGDVLFSPPAILYAGFSYNIPLSVSRPTKMMRMRISSNDSDL
jgi:hypothetical protein